MDHGYGVVQLELENFKSYRGKVVIGPFADFTAILGPNGSGKSNVMDAISFVLGVRAAHLRGTSLKDLIYSVEGEKTEKRASVTLVFKTKDERELRFRRSIRGDGSGEYRIDDVVKTWEEYDEVLKSLHILTKAKNFLVFQGDVENVAQKSPKDLTALLEMVSGSDQFREEYEAKRKHKEEATAKLMDVASKRRGMGAEKNQYRMQKKEAERFRELKAEQTNAKRDFALFQLYYIETELNAMKRELQKAKEELRELADKNKEGSQEYEQCKKTYADLHKKSLALIKAKQEKTMRQSQLQRQVDKLTLQIKNTEEKRTDAQTQVKKMKEAGKQHSKDVQALQKQLEDVKADQQAWEKRQAEETAKMEGQELTEAQYQEWKQLKQTATTKTITIAQDISALNRQKNTEALQLRSLTTQAEQLEGRRKQLGETMTLIQERRDQLRATVKKNEEEVKVTRQELADLKGSLGEREAKRVQVEQALAEVAAELSELRFEKHETGRDKKFADTLDQMKNLFSGVKGKLHELCRIPDKKYQTAVTVAMGKTMDAIVVDNAPCAMDCIQFLKEQRLPPMTFIPLDSIKAAHIDERLRRLGGTCRPIIDCIQYDDFMDPAIRYAVGATLVCDKMHEAKQVAFGERNGERHKVVTVDGSCILKNGCIQGGQATMERKARKWDEHKYEGKKRRRDELVRELDSLGDVTGLRNRELDLNSRLAALQASADSATADITAAERKLESSNKELDAISKQLKELQPRVKEAEKKVVTVVSRLEELESRKNEIEKGIFTEFSKRVKIADVQAYEERREKLRAETAAKEAEFKQLIGRIQTQLDYAERRAGTKTLKGVEKTLSDLEKKLNTETQELATATKELEKVNKEVEVVKTELEAGKKAMAQADQRMKELKKTMGSKLDALGLAKKRVTQRASACQKLRSVRAATVQKCSVEEIALPTVAVTGKRKAAIEAKRKRRKGEEGTILEPEAELEEEEEPALAEGATIASSEPFSLAEDTQTQRPTGPGAAEVISINFSNFDDRLKKMASNPKEYQRQTAQFDDLLQRLDLDLEKLAPNLKAMQRLADVEGKFDDTMRQFEECREEQRKAQAEYDEVKEKRYRRFMETFDIISDEIDKVYKVLTRDEEFPAGGTAYISLDNPTEPYNGGTKYNAMPITKRFREMEQLSGGEKTVAALALLFTIHRVHPSPFFILDEIDAALDHGNVVKVCNYVLTHCNTCQFIVISLKPEFFENASILVGVYKDQATNASRVLTWDMTQHDHADEEQRDVPK